MAGTQMNQDIFSRASWFPRHSFASPAELTRPVPSSVVGSWNDDASKLSSARTVLVVDDDQSIREALGDILGILGYNVEVACDGAQALECLRQGCDPFIIFLDLGMPVMDGWQFRQELLKEPRFAATRVVVITAASDVRLDSLQVNDLLTKPVPLERLIEVLEAEQ